MHGRVQLLLAETSAHLEHARRLFQEFAAEIHVDLCFQGFQREVAELPGAYAPPAGRLLLAQCGAEVVGCVALRRIDDRICELKRLYIQPAFRGRGLGRMLTEAVLSAARAIGYRHIRLDTLDTMTVAVTLYRSLGFGDTAPYRYNPLPGATFLQLDLP